jgi:hypothetical protein
VPAQSAAARPPIRKNRRENHREAYSYASIRAMTDGLQRQAKQPKYFVKQKREAKGIA